VVTSLLCPLASVTDAILNATTLIFFVELFPSNLVSVNDHSLYFPRIKKSPGTTKISILHLVYGHEMNLNRLGKKYK
jgi:hypothetical protein